MDSFSPKSSASSFDLGSLLKRYIRNWPWFLISCLIALFIAFSILRYHIPQYAAQAQIKIIDKENHSQLSAFNDLNILSNQSKSLKTEDEILAIKSRYNILQVVKRLKLNIQWFVLGNVINSEIYKAAPFEIKFSKPDSIINKSYYSFYIKSVSNNSFLFSEKEDQPGQAHKYGDSVSTRLGKLVVTPQFENHELSKETRYNIKITPVSQIVTHYSSKISILPQQKGSTILHIYLGDPVQKKAQDIINELLTVYNQNIILDKKAVADRTSNFINNRIKSIHSELSSVDESAAEFRSNRGLADISAQSNINLTASAENEQELQNTQIQIGMISSLSNEIESSGFNDYIPSGIAVGDSNFEGYITRYNELVAQRKKLLESSGANNPFVVQLDQQLLDLKGNIKTGVSSIKNNLNLKASALSNNLSKIRSDLYMAPKNARGLRDITRQQETKEALYLYLLQKREESQIAYASTEANIKIIDPAYSLSAAPIGADKKVYYVGAFLLGLLIPLSFIYLIDTLDTKVRVRKDLERLIGDNIILGEIPKISKIQANYLVKNNSSTFAESLRILRANLDYLIKTKGSTKKENIIFVTSSVSGEGKTLLSCNLASILSSSKNAKVLLIGGDIRNPKVEVFFKVKPQENKLNTSLGLTDYLHDYSTLFEDIITPIPLENSQVDVIFSGKKPPNPTDLLTSERLEELLDKASKTYDYVIVDTAPMLPVADTVLMSKYANVILYVIKAHATDTKVVEYPIKLIKEGKIKRLAFVLNNVKTNELGYGGKYGYGYGQKKKKWFWQS